MENACLFWDILLASFLASLLICILAYYAGLLFFALLWSYCNQRSLLLHHQPRPLNPSTWLQPSSYLKKDSWLARDNITDRSSRKHGNAQLKKQNKKNGRPQASTILSCTGAKRFSHSNCVCDRRWPCDTLPAAQEVARSVPDEWSGLHSGFH